MSGVISVTATDQSETGQVANRDIRHGLGQDSTVSQGCFVDVLLLQDIILIVPESPMNVKVQEYQRVKIAQASESRPGKCMTTKKETKGGMGEVQTPFAALLSMIHNITSQPISFGTSQFVLE